MGDTKEIWKKIVSVDDIDHHLAKNGQAEANAKLFWELFTKNQLPPGGTLLFPGIGTGQIFDYLSINELEGYNFIFTDVSIDFLDKVQERIGNRLSYKILVDDIEETQLTETVDGVVAILFLEHVIWKTAIDNLLKLSPKTFYVVIQGQSEDASSMVTSSEPLRPSIKKFSELARPEIIKKDKLDEFMASRKFHLKNQQIVPVPGGKTMIGLTYLHLWMPKTPRRRR